MIKDRQIKTIIPFLIVFLSTYFLSDADPFEVFGARTENVKFNIKLVWLLFIGDAGQAVVWFCCSLIFFIAWRRNRADGRWFIDIFWQLSGIFFCWSVLSMISLISNFANYLWIYGMVRLFVFVFGVYFLNTVYSARNLLYHPETPEEMLLKAKKFDELIKTIKRDDKDSRVD